METETIKNNSGGKITFLILISIVSLFVVYYSVMLVLSPGHKLTELKEEYGVKVNEKNPVDERIFTDSAYLMLFKEKAFLQSKVTMAETDSIYLSLNLNDSTANLEISGVVVHKSRISKIGMSSILRRGNENIILSLLASPFTISESWATIKKDPVMLKMAPKDTSEYKPDIMPDTSLTEPVNYMMEMTNGTRIYIYESEVEKASDRRSAIVFDYKDKFRDTWRSLKSVTHLKVPEYHPYIKIRVPRTDAKIIYRALPVKGQVGVFR
jgi:hypothetical protein